VSLVLTQSLWTWDTSGPLPVVVTYSSGTNTKTGLQPVDLRNFCGVPIQIFGNPPTPIADPQLVGWIRAAEDYVEQYTSLLLCPTWVASPPLLSPSSCIQAGIQPVSPSGIQNLGVDYDLPDSAYDFYFDRSKEEGWLVQQMRYRPLRNVPYPPTVNADGGTNPIISGESGLPIGADGQPYILRDKTAIKNVAFIYPLLQQYFNVPTSWYVEDQDFGALRIVPSANVQMLPLFALQLAIEGFNQSVPGGIGMQYVAGLTQNDYATRFFFIKQLVLAQACIYALTAIQGSVNLGIEKHQMLVDGVQYMAQYSARGAFRPLIDTYTAMRDELLQTTMEQVAGPMFIMLGS
jgi:hypothetical protein